MKSRPRTVVLARFALVVMASLFLVNCNSDSTTGSTAASTPEPPPSPPASKTAARIVFDPNTNFLAHLKSGPAGVVFTADLSWKSARIFPRSGDAVVIELPHSGRYEWAFKACGWGLNSMDDQIVWSGSAEFPEGMTTDIYLDWNTGEYRVLKECRL